jgi:hypothetical protein
VRSEPCGLFAGNHGYSREPTVTGSHQYRDFSLMLKHRKRFIAPSLIALSLTCAACSSNDTRTASTPANAVDTDGLPVLTEEQKAQGVVCKREPVTGTRISKKTCTTREQRERLQQLGRESLEDSRRARPGPDGA